MHYAHIRNYAQQELVRIGLKAVPFLIENLMHDDPNFFAGTINVLGNTAGESVIMPIRKLPGLYPKDANIRFGPMGQGLVRLDRLFT